MLLREQLEERELNTLSPFAAKARLSKGRTFPDDQCMYRTDFQRDRDRIIHSKAFRRLMHKTQVFLLAEGDHYRTRLNHTLDVSQISRTVARALGLNEDLTEAIALGHDLGHTPFGHSGESILNQIHTGGFQHNAQSLRVVEVLENINPEKRGMNLTFEVRDGILNHTGSGIPSTLEGQIVKLCDRVAYISHDIDDAIRGNIISTSDLPKECIDLFGTSHSNRVNYMVSDIISNSDGKCEISMSQICLEHMLKLRKFMFENVYYNTKVKMKEDLNKVETIIETLYTYFQTHPQELPEEYYNLRKEYEINEIIKDYIAGMTDRYAMNMYETLIPH